MIIIGLPAGAHGGIGAVEDELGHVLPGVCGQGKAVSCGVVEIGGGLAVHRHLAAQAEGVVVIGVDRAVKIGVSRKVAPGIPGVPGCLTAPALLDETALCIIGTVGIPIGGVLVQTVCGVVCGFAL